MINEYPKDILFDIDMQLYDEFNDTIATMNDHLGDIYSLRDVEEVEKAEKEKEIKLLREAVKNLQIIIKKQSYTNKKLRRTLKTVRKERNKLNKSDASKEQSSMRYYNSYKELVDQIKVAIERYEEKFKAENGKKTINYHLYRIIIDEVLKPLLKED